MEKLPKNWVEATIPEFITKDDVFIDGDWIETKDQDPEGQVRLIQLADVGIINFRDKSNRFMNIENAKRLNCTFLEQGDVLVARMPDPIGRACIFPLKGKNVTVVDVAIIRPNEKFYNRKLLMYFINSVQIHNEISILASGSTRQRISRKNLGSIKFPLPPLAEQQRIVAKLDTLFEQLETIKKSLDNVPVLLKNFKQQVLTQAVTGKLTEEWREGKELESIEIQLKKTLAIRDELIKTKKLKKVKDYGEILKDEQDLNIPFLWRWLRWVDLLSLNEYSMKRGPFGSALKKDDFVESGIRVFEQYNPINDDPYWARYYISEQRYKELKSFTADSGDLLISCSGVTLGRITEIPADTEKGIINQALLKLSLNEDIILNSYFIKLFRSKYIQEKIFDNAQGSAIPNMVGVDVLKKMALPIPPIEEQQEIVGRVESLFAKADAIEAQYTTLKEKIDKMPQAILHKAFKGELTQQLDTDGDARDLLKAIEKLKNTNTKTKKNKL